MEYMEVTKAFSYFYESKKLLDSLIKRKTCQLDKKKENRENIFFKALADKFRLSSKIMDDSLLSGLHEKVMVC